jgi:hypothetical protein
LVFGSTHVTEKARVSRVREKFHEKNNREARIRFADPDSSVGGEPLSTARQTTEKKR